MLSQFAIPPSCDASTSYESFAASGQIVRAHTWETRRGDGLEYCFNGTQYEIIERRNSNSQDAVLSDVDDVNDCDYGTDNSNKQSMFISIAYTQISRCDHYLLPEIWGSDCPVVPYAHGLLVIDKCSGLMLNIEPGPTGRKKWITLDGRANDVDMFAIIEDRSRLLGLVAAADKISLREWEISTGTLSCERTYGRS